jgi:hypothetical protein
MVVKDTLAYLAGEWTLTREIVDHRSGRSGSFDGVANVRTSGRRGRYEEHGRLRFGGYDGSARRTLELVGTNGSGVAVLFADGRPFFDLDLLMGTCQAVHQCSEDRYELEFGATSTDRLLERWRVCGPEKDYEARTTWRRNCG